MCQDKNLIKDRFKDRIRLRIEQGIREQVKLVRQESEVKQKTKRNAIHIFGSH